MRAAVRFLTVLPVPGDHRPPGAATVVAFPAVGVLAGVAWLGALHLGLAIGTPLVAAAFMLVVDAALTGVLHLDACGDVADGVASRRPPGEAVQIMREPAVGAVGAAAIVLAALLRFVLLTGAVDAGLALVAAPVAGRTAMVVSSRCCPPGTTAPSPGPSDWTSPRGPDTVTMRPGVMLAVQ